MSSCEWIHQKILSPFYKGRNLSPMYTVLETFQMGTVGSNSYLVCVWGGGTFIRSCQREGILPCKDSPNEKGGGYFHVGGISFQDIFSLIKAQINTGDTQVKGMIHLIDFPT